VGRPGTNFWQVPVVTPVLTQLPQLVHRAFEEESARCVENCAGAESTAQLLRSVIESLFKSLSFLRASSISQRSAARWCDAFRRTDDDLRQGRLRQMLGQIHGDLPRVYDRTRVVFALISTRRRPTARPWLSGERYLVHQSCLLASRFSREKTSRGDVRASGEIRLQGIHPPIYRREVRRR